MEKNVVALAILVKLHPMVDEPGFGEMERLSLRPKERLHLLRSSGATAGDFD